MQYQHETVNFDDWNVEIAMAIEKIQKGQNISEAVQIERRKFVRHFWRGRASVS
jgi:hypothetical protein